MFSATRKASTILHDASSGTIAHEGYSLWCGTNATLAYGRVEDHEGSAPQRVYILCAIISVCISSVGGPRTLHALRRPRCHCLSGWDNTVS